MRESRRESWRQENNMWTCWSGFARTAGCFRPRFCGRTAGVSRWIGFWTFRQPRRFGLEDRGIGTPSASAGKSAISFSSIPAIWMEIGPEGGSLKRYSKKRPPIEMRLSKFNRVEYRGGNRSMLAVKAVNNSYLLYKINSRYGF